MPVDITIPDLRPEVIATLAARAARERKSTQQYLLEQLEQLARRPTLGERIDPIDPGPDPGRAR